jgi:hypothetical protein
MWDSMARKKMFVFVVSCERGGATKQNAQRSDKDCRYVFPRLTKCTYAIMVCKVLSHRNTHTNIEDCQTHRLVSNPPTTHFSIRLKSQRNNGRWYRNQHPAKTFAERWEHQEASRSEPDPRNSQSRAAFRAQTRPRCLNRVRRPVCWDRYERRTAKRGGDG